MTLPEDLRKLADWCERRARKTESDGRCQSTPEQAEPWFEQARTYSARAASCRQAADALDSKDRRIAELEAAISWALGEGDSDFGDNVPGTAHRYWWRSELQRRAAGGPK